MFLLDVNALIALGDRDHVHHFRVRTWFRSISGEGWATCPLTENGFVRILSQPAYVNTPGDPATMREILRRLCLYAGHQFWEDSLSLRDARKFPDLTGVTANQLTDFYLLALAIRRRGRLATLDRRIKPDALPEGERAYFLIP